MSFEGFFRLGETEIVNSARAASYVGSLMPNFGLDDCTDCDGVAEATGDGRYRSPVVDTAPWIDSSNPTLDDFWGVYPLGVTGLDDGTRQTTVTELTGDGGVTSRPRAASREIRYDVLLVGRTKAAVDEGFHWLNRALDAVRCDDQTLGCTGTELEFFASCPPVCDYTGIVTTIVQWAGLDAAQIQRTNLARNPRGLLFPSQNWSGGGVNGPDWEKSYSGAPGVLHPRIGRTNLAHDPHARNEAGFMWRYQSGTGGSATITYETGTDTPDGRSGYHRAVINTASTGGTEGPYYRQDTGVSGVAGDVWTFSFYYRSTTTALNPINVVAAFRSGGSTVNNATSSINAIVGEWVRASVTLTATGAYDGFQLWVNEGAAGTPAAGTVIDTTMMLAERVDTLDRYFDGGSAHPEADYAWAGAVDDSASTEEVYTDARVNYHPNPRYIGPDTVTGGTGGPTVQEDMAAGGPDGGGYTRVQLTADQGGNIYLGGDSVPLEHLALGDQDVGYRGSTYIRVPTSGTVDVRLVFLDSGGSQIVQQIAIANAVPDAWVRVVTSPVSVPYGTTDWRIVAAVRGDNVMTAGQFIDVGSRMLEEGVAIGDYFDGDTPSGPFTDFFWSGPENDSPSISADAIFSPPAPLDVGFQWANAIYSDASGTVFAVAGSGGDGEGWRSEIEEGESYGASLWIYVPEGAALDISLRAQWEDESGVDVEVPFNLALVSGAPSGWNFLEGNTGPAPAGAALLVVYPRWSGGAGIIQAGQAVAWGQRIIENVPANPGPYFDGGTDPLGGEDGVITWWSSNVLDPEAISYEGTLKSDVGSEISRWSLKADYGNPDGPAWSTTNEVALCPEPVMSVHGEVQSMDAVPNTLRLTRRIDNLTAGAWYRVSVSGYGSLSGPSFAATLIARASIRGTDAATSGVSTDATYACLNEPMAPMFFQATSCIAFLDVETTTAGSGIGGGGTLGLNVTALEVRRTSSSALVYQTQFPNDGTYFNGWQHATPQGMVFSIERSSLEVGGGTALRMSPDTVSTTPANAVIATRSVRGLVPGRRYRAAMVVTLNNPGPTMDFTLTADAGDTLVSATETGAQFEPVILVVEFIAESDSATIGLTIPDPVDVSSVDGLVFFRSATVEDITEEDPPPPDLTRNLQRTLYRVSALTGPTRSELYDKTCGYMMRASFGLVAGIPHHIGPLIEAGHALGGTGTPIIQTPCYNGEAERYNLIPTPSFENATAVNSNWAPIQAADSTITSFITGSSLYGSRVMRITVDDSSAFSVGARMFLSPADYPTVTPPGSTMTLSAYVRWSADVPGAEDLRVGLAMDFYDVDESPAGFYSSVELTPLNPSAEPNGWVRVTFTVAAPSNATNVEPRIFVQQTGDGWPLGYLFVDAMMLEFGGVATEYFDGSFADASWIGPANNAISFYRAPEVSEVVDPDCPPLPAPPAPPDIDESCVTTPTEWVRYSIPVSSEMIPLYSSVLPVVTLRTADVAARSVRMRWYPNPDGVPTSELDPCDFEGEVTVSYMPPNAEMVVDGISRSATVMREGLPDSPATHLLYGPDGGPMEWPELRCNQDYIFTVDVDADGDVSQLDVLLSLGLKV